MYTGPGVQRSGHADDPIDLIHSGNGFAVDIHIYNYYERFNVTFFFPYYVFDSILGTVYYILVVCCSLL